jgi:hypothetical protein
MAFVIDVQAGRRMRSDSDYVDTVIHDFADHSSDLGRTDVKPDDDLALFYHSRILHSFSHQRAFAFQKELP